MLPNEHLILSSDIAYLSLSIDKKNESQDDLDILSKENWAIN